MVYGHEHRSLPQDCVKSSLQPAPSRHAFAMPWGFDGIWRVPCSMNRCPVTHSEAVVCIFNVAVRVAFNPSLVTEMCCRVLRSGQQYEVGLELKMPTSHVNRRVGVFMVSASLRQRFGCQTCGFHILRNTRRVGALYQFYGRRKISLILTSDICSGFLRRGGTRERASSEHPKLWPCVVVLNLTYAIYPRQTP